MIAEAVRILRDELATYIATHKRNNDPIVAQDVILENIANLESEEGADLANKIILSLVNLQEEGTLKNLPNVRQNPITGGYEYDRPPAHINLYLLISSSPDASLSDAYELALDRLSLIVEFFQAKNFFSIANSPHSSIAQSLGNPPPDGIRGTEEALRLADIKMYVDLFSLTFEQLNHLWGSLGGKQIPSALYKVRIVPVQRRTGIDAPVIEQIATESSPNLPN